MKNLVFSFGVIIAIVLCQPVKAIAQNSAYNKTSGYENITLPDNNNPISNSQIQEDTEPDSLIHIKTDFPVNTYKGKYGAPQYNVKCASDTAGNIGLVWVDYRNSRVDIYAQFYKNNGEKYGTNIKVNDYDICGAAYPLITGNRKGDFIIMWSDGYNMLFAQRFSYSGDKKGNNIIISQYCLDDSRSISAAVNEDGSFIAVWAGIDYNDSVYTRVYNTQDVPGNIIQLNSPIYGIYHGLHAAAGSDSSYAIIWSAMTSGSVYQVYMQMIDYYGNMKGNPTIVNDSQNTINEFPLITATDNGYFFLTWQEYNSASYEKKMTGMIYNVKNGFTSGPFGLNSTAVPQAIGSDREKYCIIGANDETYRIIDTSGSLVTYTVPLNPGAESTETYTNSAVSNMTKNYFWKACIGKKYSSTDVYLQKYSNLIVPVESIFKVNDDSVSSSQKNPLVYHNNKGISIVLWDDNRNGRVDLYGRIYDENYHPVGNDFQINPFVNNQWTVKGKAVTSRPDGTFVVGYLGYGESYTGDIYMQCITIDGKLTDRIYVAKNQGLECKIKMNCSNENELVISWYNNYNVFIKKYDKTLNTYVYWKNLASGTDAQRHAISIDDRLNIFHVWTNDNYSSGSRMKLYGMIYGPDGKPVSDSIVVCENNYGYSSIDCALDDKDYTVMWSGDGTNIRRAYFVDDRYLNYDFKSYSYVNAGTLMQFRNKRLLLDYVTYNTTNFLYFDDSREQVKEFSIPNSNYISCPIPGGLINSCSLYKDQIFHVYEKIEDITSFNIAGNILQLNNINLSDKNIYKMINDDYLYNNYPNPFNGKTIIPYKLLSPHRVKLVVYNILGQEVKVLVDEFQEKGFYEVELDASELASGVYIYKLDAFKTFIKKLIVLK